MVRSAGSRHPSRRFLVKVRYRRAESMEGYVNARSRAEAQREGLKIAKRVTEREYGPGRTGKHRVVRVRELKVNDYGGYHSELDDAGLEPG